MGDTDEITLEAQLIMVPGLARPCLEEISLYITISRMERNQPLLGGQRDSLRAISRA
jgi:hypothetical protein